MCVHDGKNNIQHSAILKGEFFEKQNKQFLTFSEKLLLTIYWFYNKPLHIMSEDYT